ncbi:fatty acid desaturase family protein [Rubripirellula reticaptiva]|uniref:Fatty acid desaturase n=1 Tax=Rubripirellula reticaptiva TaxID=2528013 RepID=A0A5C6ESY4_9BACT|nr:fatty acid desaturase [Rubripirellula reticaptiva]TWU51775.1 Fatty acid desaturase [Rubripirellula reticaptiva]
MCKNHQPISVSSRKIVADLFDHNAAIYWTDFLFSLAVAYGAAAVYFSASMLSATQIISFLIAGCGLYRVASFMHEIVHFRSREMRTFRIVWNLLAGIPMLTPTFFYESHVDHHNARHYGTDHDGEYLPLAASSHWSIGVFLAQIFLQPILVTLRFLLTPLTFLHPRLRLWTLQHASSFVIDFKYCRMIPPRAPLRTWALMDLACSIRAWAIFACVIAGVTQWTRLPQLYCLAAFALGLNHIRTLAAHRYLSHGQPLSHDDQVLDSANVTGTTVFTELLFPLGMRYHGLHHLFPRLPYHNLGIAHRRLMAELPKDSAYRATVYPSWFSVVRELVENSRWDQGSASPG